MKALFVSNDPSILVRGSAVRARMRTYAAAIGTLHIVNRAPVASSESDGPLTVHGIVAGKLTGARAFERAVWTLIEAEAIEVVSAQDPFEYGRIAARAIRGTSAKLHIQVHTDFLSPWFVRGGIFRSPFVSMPAKNRIRRLIAGRVLSRADGIRVVSERVRQSLIARYGTRIPDPVVIPIAVGTDVPAPAELPAHSFPFAFVTVGRLEPEKRIEDIIEALSRVVGRYPALGLIVIGEGRERDSLVALAAQKGVADHVLFAGARTPEETWGMMRSAQAYIQASAYEGYGRTLIEAALARIPIITTDVGVVGEVFTGYEDVLAAPPGDPAQLAVHMVALLEDRGALERLVRAAEAKARAHLARFTDLPDLIARDLERLLPGS